MLGFFRRNLRLASSETKTNAYITMVRSNLEYCASAWNLHQKKIRAENRNGPTQTLNRYHNTSSVTSMLDELSWETLKSRRIKLQLTDLYNIQHNLIDVEASKYLTKRSTTVRSKLSSQLNLYQPSSVQFKFSFFRRTIIHWNSLPASVAEAPSLAQFKKKLSTQPF